MPPPAEAFAAFLDHTDDQIGRVVNALRNAGELDNTIFVVLADNGLSGRAAGDAARDEILQRFAGGADEAINRLDTIGGPFSHTNYPWGWAQCGNSPFKWYKQNTHEEVYVPMVMHWPAGLGRLFAAANVTSSSMSPISSRQFMNCSA